MKPEVAVLFARRDSIYKTMPECDVWDIERDARNWPGGLPVVAHPPCRAWGRLRGLAKPRPDEKALALFAVEQVSRFGGVLEHPASSSLWDAAGLPRPFESRCPGGWTFSAPQHWWGHPAEKDTWFFVVGVSPSEIPPLPLSLETPRKVITNRKGLKSGMPGFRTECTKREREATPEYLAAWLVALAIKCGKARA